MKAKKGFNLREICGEQIIVAEGRENIDFTNIISMNETSAFLWKSIQDKESFTTDELVDLLIDNYQLEDGTQLDREKVKEDVKTMLDNWIKAEIVEL